MAGRRGTGDGDLATALTRLHEWSFTRLVEYWFSAVERDLRSLLRLDRLARHVVGRCTAGSLDYLRPLFRQGARSLGEKPATAARPEARGSRPADQDFPARDAGKYAVGMLVDGKQFCPLLFDLVLVCYASAARFEADRDGDGGAVHARQHPELPRHVLLGLDGRHHRSALGDDHPGRNRDPGSAALSLHR